LGEVARPAIPALIEISKDSNFCFYAFAALRLIGPAALPALTNATSSTNQTIREAAVFALAEMGTNAESVLPLLVSLLDDSNSQIRRAAVYAVASVGTNQSDVAVPALVKALDDPDRKVCRPAIFGLRLFGNNADIAVPKLIELLGKRGEFHSAALALAGVVGTNQAIAPITQALTNQDIRIQRGLIYILGSFQSEALDSIPSLLPFARDEDERLRNAAIHALIKIGAEPDVLAPILIDELANTDSIIRSDVLHALGNFGPKAKAAVPILLEQIEFLRTQLSPLQDDFFEEQSLLQSLFEERYSNALNNFPQSYYREFQTLKKIDPETADRVRKAIEGEKKLVENKK
jgi:HEAT repeat protein